jgi:hypothetical protein
VFRRGHAAASHDDLGVPYFHTYFDDFATALFSFDDADSAGAGAIATIAAPTGGAAGGGGPDPDPDAHPDPGSRTGTEGGGAATTVEAARAADGETGAGGAGHGRANARATPLGIDGADPGARRRSGSGPRPTTPVTQQPRQTRIPGVREGTFERGDHHARRPHR